MKLIEAIHSLAPNASWVLIENDYDNIIWNSDNIQRPSKELILAEAYRLQAEYDAKQYQRKRAAEYPSFADQFDTLYHGGYDAWKAQIDAIKLKYPKP
jgi:hypothetical protein